MPHNATIGPCRLSDLFSCACVPAFFLFVAILLCFSPVSSAQHLKFESFTVGDGLSQNTVQSIVRDPQGFMWFGTKDGLNRFDTHSFKTYRTVPEDGQSLPGNEVTALWIDHNGLLWVGTDGGLGRYDRINDNFIRVAPAQNMDIKPEGAEILAIYGDSRARIWVGTAAGLYLVRDESRAQYWLEQPGMGLRIQEAVFAIHEDQTGSLWIGTASAIFKVEANGDSLYVLPNIEVQVFPGAKPGGPVSAILEHPAGTMWIAYREKGLIRYNVGSGLVKRYHSGGDNRLSDDRIMDISADANGHIWIGTRYGLNILDPESDSVQVYFGEPAGEWELRDNAIHAVYTDQYDNVWLGTQYGGAHLHSNRFMLFAAHQFIVNRGEGPVRPVATCITGDDAGSVYFAVANYGVFQFDVRRRAYKRLELPGVRFSVPAEEQIRCMYADQRGTIWYSTDRGVVHTFRQDARDIDAHPDLKLVQRASDGDVVVSIVQDHSSHIWLGTSENGLIHVDTKTRDIRRIHADAVGHHLPSNRIRSMMLGNDGRIWVGTRSGLYLLDPKTGKEVVFTSDPSDTMTLASDDVSTLFTDHSGTLWVGTAHGGLHMFNGPAGTFTRFGTGDGLAGTTVCGILEDRHNRLWISTNKGLSLFDRSSHRIISYNTRDGLPGVEFIRNACQPAPNGEMYFASTQGLVSFFPDRLVVNDRPPPVVFTGLRLLGRVINAGGPAGILEKNITETTGLRLHHRDNTFTIVFAALNYINSKKNRYAYRVLGGEERWMHTDVPMITFKDLDPGRYVLEVKGSNNDMVWNHEPAVLHITIAHPPWTSPWAYILYAFVLIATVVAAFRIVLSRSRFRKRMNEEQAQQARMSEMHRARINFFTHIAHQLTSPLYSIAHSVEELLRAQGDNQIVRNRLSAVQLPVERLIRLANQLLDFSRLERDEFRIHVQETDLVDFVQEFKLAFEDVANDKKVALELQIPAHELVTWIDRSQFEKVLYSLFVNAFNRSQEGEKVAFRIRRSERGSGTTGPMIVIEVEDSGPAITDDRMGDIFDLSHESGRAHGLTPGYDVGLAVAQGIVKAHGGHIELYSPPRSPGSETRTVFAVHIPQGVAHLGAGSLAPSILEPAGIQAFEVMDDLLSQGSVLESGGDVDRHKYRILLVGHDPEEQDYLAAALRQDYDVSRASGGTEALAFMQKELPDLVISSLLIPGMHGLALCRTIRENASTVHIPVILLTSRASWIFKSQGLKNAPDYFIARPFSVDALKLHIQKALTSSFHGKSAGREDASAIRLSSVSVTVQDEVFLKQVVKIVEDYMGDPDFGVEKLAHEIGMSRPVLYRRLKTITGKSVIDFITDIRLKRAALLIGSGGWSIADVAFEVGISDRRHFTRLFKKAYQQTPTEYLANRKASGELAGEDA